MATTSQERELERASIREELAVIRLDIEEGRPGRSVDGPCVEVIILSVRAMLNTGETVEAGIKADKP